VLPEIDAPDRDVGKVSGVSSFPIAETKRESFDPRCVRTILTRAESRMATFLTILTAIVSLFLILIILLQRGRGGGLTGALGGMGGQSAFGTKAGDVFTRITVVLAVIWVVLNGFNIFAYRQAANQYFAGRPDAFISNDDKADAAKKEGEAATEGTKESVPPKDGEQPATQDSGKAEAPASGADQPATTTPAAGGTEAAPATTPAAESSPATPPATPAADAPATTPPAPAGEGEKK